MSKVKVALVTGANQGIGYGIVRRLCKEHPNWIIYGTSRSVKNGQDACEKLKGEGLTAQFLEADLTKPDTVTAVKEKLVKDHGGLDILINSAGIAFKNAATEPYSVKAEDTLNTNVFGTNMVCEQLFPILKDGARVVVLSGFLGFKALHQCKNLNTSRYESYIKSDPPMHLSDVLQSMKDFVSAVKAGDYAEKGWADDMAYIVSKLGCTLLARAYQHDFNKKPERDIVVNAADPGHVNTNMSSRKGGLTVDQGADTPYYLSVLPPNTEIRGEHVSDRKVVKWE